MFAFKISLPTFYLVVISIINHVCASPDPKSVETCQELLNEEWYLNESDDAGLYNFQSAFKFTTLKQIENTSMPPIEGNETDDQRHTRELKKYITTMYYLDLITNNIIDDDLMKTPNQWCQETLKEVKQNKEERMIDCLEYTKLLLRNEQYQENPKIILHFLYLDWTFNKLRRLLIRAAVTKKVISIIHHVRAPLDPEAVETCQKILKDKDVFQDFDNAGPLNFRNAFKYLSLKQLKLIFMEPEEGNETDEEEHKRKLHHYITEQYFLDFMVNNRIDVSHLAIPNQWCQERLKRVKYNPKTKYNPKIKNDEAEQITDCLEYTTMLLENPQDKNYPEIIFQTLYKDWSYHDLIFLTFPHKYFGSISEWSSYKKKFKYCVNNYSKEYFNYYDEALSKMDLTQENFRSIKEYCENIGHIFVSGSTGSTSKNVLLIDSHNNS